MSVSISPPETIDVIPGDRDLACHTLDLPLPHANSIHELLICSIDITQQLCNVINRIICRNKFRYRSQICHDTLLLRQQYFQSIPILTSRVHQQCQRYLKQRLVASKQERGM